MAWVWMTVVKTKAGRPESHGAGYGDRKKLPSKSYLGPSPALCVI